MRTELESKLSKNYPKIFANQSSFDAHIEYLGIECSDGWYPIINALCSNIQSYLDWINRNQDSPPIVQQVVVTQIKEKFGGLRFYYDGGDDRILGMLSMAESMADITCEKCGSPGKRRGKGWIYTACNAHTFPEHLGDDNV
jgi:hypothetical protein